MFKLCEYFLHVFNAIVMLEVITQHLEDDLQQREEILIGLKGLVSPLKRTGSNNISVYAPDDVVKNAGQEGHEALKD